MQNKKSPRQQASEVLLLRIRVATAESSLKVLREQARQARRRRKEAKRLAQRARQQFKQSKADLSDLRAALARAEANMFKADGRALAGKMAKRARAGKTNIRPAKKAKTSARKRRAPQPAPRKKAPAKRTKTVLQNPSEGVVPEPKSSTPKIIDDHPTIYEQRNPDQGTPEVEDQKV